MVWVDVVRSQPVLTAQALYECGSVGGLSSVVRLLQAQQLGDLRLDAVQVGHGHGCRCEVGRSRNRFLDFVALNITTRPEPGQGKVTVRNINCTNQFPMNDQPGMTMT